MMLPNRYIAVDIETTDSEAETGDVVQIGAVVLNQDLTTGAEFSEYVRPTTPFRAPAAMAVNKITEETLEAARHNHEVLTEFEDFARLGTGSNRPELAAWGAYFDVTFLRDYYRKIGRRWPFSYKSLDLKAISVWEASSRGLNANAGQISMGQLLGIPFEGKEHDGLADIKNSVKIIRHFNENKWNRPSQ